MSGALNPLGHRTTLSFDLLDQPIARTDALSAITSPVYGPLGRAQVTVNVLGYRNNGI